MRGLEPPRVRRAVGGSSGTWGSGLLYESSRVKGFDPPRQDPVRCMGMNGPRYGYALWKGSETRAASNAASTVRGSPSVCPSLKSSVAATDGCVGDMGRHLRAPTRTRPQCPRGRTPRASARSVAPVPGVAHEVRRFGQRLSMPRPSACLARAWSRSTGTAGVRVPAWPRSPSAR